MIALCYVLAALPVGADVSVTASLSSSDVRVGETVQLTISVEGAISGVSEPEMPELDGLVVISSGRSQSMSFNGGSMSASIQFTYIIQATEPGSYTIPPISVRVSGQKMTTQVLALTVRGGGAAPNPAGTPPPAPPPPVQPVPGKVHEDIFVTTKVSNETPFEGEQVVLTMSFYKRADLALADTPSYSPPETPGLISEALPEPQQQTVMLGDAQYVVIQRFTALFAPTAQQYEIGPASITFTRHFFDPEQTISSDPIVLRAKPLPSGKPEDFCGLVGEMTAELAVDATQTRSGDTVTARVTITGVGDVRRIAAPKLPVSGPCKVYEAGSQASTKARNVGDRQLLGGVASFEYLLVPQEAGRLTVGPVRMHYFDPTSRSYRPVATDAVVLDVAQGDVTATQAESTPADELAYIRTGNRGLRARAPVTSSLWFWLVQLVPLLGLAVVARQRAEGLRRERDPRYRRFVEARTRAHALLAAARRTEQQGRSVFELADEALSGYVADKTGVSATTLSPDGARDTLVQVGASDELATRVAASLRMLRAGRFAPGAAGLEAGQIISSVSDLIDGLERELGRRGA